MPAVSQRVRVKPGGCCRLAKERFTSSVLYDSQRRHSPGRSSPQKIQRRISQMKFMSTWTFQGGVLPEAAARFLAGEAVPEPGTTLLGRWHNVDLSGGFALYETDDPAALYRGSLKWADLLDLNTVAVIEDADAGPALAARFKK